MNSIERKGVIPIPARVPILGIGVDVQRFSEALDQLRDWVHDPTPRYVCTCTVYTLMMAREDPSIFEALQSASMVAADGMPVVWQQRRTGNSYAERIYGPDVMLALCRTAIGARHVLFGGMPGVPERLAEKLKMSFPGISISDSWSPPIFHIGDTPDPAVVARLNQTEAQIIWVGLGSPKQDWWMHTYRPLLRSNLLIGVGAAFDFLSGTKQQAPRWMQQRGLEWAFRLAQEPRRLARRYLVYNTRFLYALWRGS